MSNLSAERNPSIPLERTMGIPAGGPAGVPITLDFAATAAIDLDYSNMQQRNWLRMVQTIWVDNAASAVGFIITVQGSGQVIRVPALSQAYVSVVAPNPVKLTFGSTGGVVLQVILLNYPVPTAVWQV